MKAERFTSNPLITPLTVKPILPNAEVFCAFNPGAIEHGGQIILLLRVAEKPKCRPGYVSTFFLDPDTEYREPATLHVPLDDPDLNYPDPRAFIYKGTLYLTSMSYLRVARSTDGERFALDDKPLLFPEGVEEEYGCEDPRITFIDGIYYLNYSAISPKSGITTKYATTTDLTSVTRGGIWFCPDNKDVCLFPQRVRGRYVALHRPSSSFSGNCIWIAYSDDLKSWGDHKLIIRPRAGAWDGARVGAGSHPILTHDGWLEIYHGATAGDTYCLGGLLLDKSDPSKILARSREPIVVPCAPYEVEGVKNQVVFTNGMIVRGDELLVYYGAADTVTCGLRMSVAEILQSLR